MRHTVYSMKHTGHSQRLWPVFLLLTTAVVLPSACVLWFMNQAMQNERLAVRQRLTEIYRTQLRSAADSVLAAWSERISTIEKTSNTGYPPKAFASLVQSGVADSILIHKKGRPVYPDVPLASKAASEPRTRPWREAVILEMSGKNPDACAEAYGKIAGGSDNTSEKAQAYLAQARCLNKAGGTEKAIRLLTGTLTNASYRNTVDTQGRAISPSAILFALELMKSPSHPDFIKTATLLSERLNDYGRPAMPANQRRFLMRQLQTLWPGHSGFPTLAAEEMAAAFHESTPSSQESGRLQQTENPEVWSYQSEDRTVAALFRQESLEKILTSGIPSLKPVPGILLQLQAPGSESAAFLETGLGETLPAWKLVLYLDKQDPFQSASSRNITLYLWIGVLMTVAIVTLSLLAAGYLRRQIRLTRLKNDLIATVSHELKTPLASMRLLVDTLLDGHYRDAQQTLEYLEIISKENARLSNLIEEFLTFSRMERNKTQFDLAPIRPEEFIQPAVDAVKERLQASDCEFKLDLEPELPTVRGDRDALTTVLVNLLDNALKYSKEEKKIQLRGFRSKGRLCLEVEDNGIGFSRSAAKKIFDRFYQVDQSLSRNAGGCGLGLSIVQFIVSAHGGEITTRSQPGTGSTFTVFLPVV